MEKRWYHHDFDLKKPGVEAINNPDYMSLAAAIQNLLLAAHSLNLGACWTGVSEEFRTALDKLIDVPETHMLAANIAIGHYDEVPSTVHRKPAGDVIKFIS